MLKAQVRQLILERDGLAKELQRLYTPSVLLEKADYSLKRGDFTQAKSFLGELLERFPDSREAGTVTKRLGMIEREERMQAVARARMESALAGYAALITAAVPLSDLELKMGSAWTGADWRYDCYPGTCHVSSADRGKTYISATVSVTARSKNPVLPGIYLYALGADGKLHYRDRFHVRLARWEDYATYLGNYNDDSNNFSKAETVHFAIGIEVPEEMAQQRWAIVVRDAPCYRRVESRLANPPVGYVARGCSRPARNLDSDSFLSTQLGYWLVKLN